MLGTIRRYDSTRAFGFISGDDGSDVFLHANDLKRAGINSIEVGDRIDVDAEVTPKGLRVRSIHSVERAIASRSGTPRRFYDLTGETA